MATPAQDEVTAELQDVIDALGQDVTLARQELRQGAVRPERINAMFRHGHTIKGLLGMMGHKQAQRLAHVAEDLMESLRMGRIDVTQEALSTLLHSLEFCSRLALELEPPQQAAPKEGLQDLVDKLQALARGHKALVLPNTESQDSALDQQLPEELRRMLTEYEEHRFDHNRALGRHMMAAKSTLPLATCDTALPELEAQLSVLAEIIARLPSPNSGADGSITFDILLASENDLEAVAAGLQRPDVQLRYLMRKAFVVQEPPVLAKPQRASDKQTQGLDAGAAAIAEQPQQAPESAHLAVQTVRVDIRRLDHLMHLVGELSGTRSGLAQLAARVRAQVDPAALAEALEQEGQRLERRISTIQAQVLEARMVPLAPLFERLMRAGTKLALDLGIDVQFTTVGGQTELDKRIVEELTDPLLHLLRNAIDHGLEPADVRQASGKSRTGTVRLWAQAQGAHVAVGVADDGAGMDALHIGEAAVARGLVAADRLASMALDERLRLIFLPGFSTRQQISEYSGRGVGLDIVKTKLERLGGGVDITTQKNAGTTFTLMAPVTLAIIPALIVEADGSFYALPIAHVAEAVAIEPQMVHPSQGALTLKHRDNTLTLTALADLLASTSAPPTSGCGQQAPFAIIVGLAAQKTALAVDNVVGQQDIVIKPLGARLSHIRGVAGAAQLGDQGLILVLDVVNLTQDAASTALSSAAPVAPIAPAGREQR